MMKYWDKVEGEAQDLQPPGDCPEVKVSNGVFIRLRQNTLSRQGGTAGMNGETNHGEAGPSTTGLRRRVSYAVISLDTPSRLGGTAGSFILDLDLSTVWA